MTLFTLCYLVRGASAQNARPPGRPSKDAVRGSLIQQEPDPSLGAQGQGSAETTSSPLRAPAEVSSSSSPEVSSTKSKPALTTEAEVRLAFTHGCNAYVYGSYREAVNELTRLVRPEVLLNSSEDLEVAYKYLGLGHFYLGEFARSKEFLRDLLYLNPQHSFDAARIPPNAMSLINKLKLELQSTISERQSALNLQRELNRRRERERSRQLIILEQQVNQRLIAALPFGAGQFQNRDESLGYFFLASELIAVGLSTGFFWGVESLRLPNGRYAKEDYLTARQLQRAQIVSGGIAVGLMVSGVIHAFVTFKPRHDVGNYLDPNLQYGDDIDSDLDDEQLFQLQ